MSAGHILAAMETASRGGPGPPGGPGSVAEIGKREFEYLLSRSIVPFKMRPRPAGGLADPAAASAAGAAFRLVQQEAAYLKEDFYKRWEAMQRPGKDKLSDERSDSLDAAFDYIPSEQKGRKE